MTAPTAHTTAATVPALPAGYTLHRMTLFDIRALHRLERVIFPLDAYGYSDLLILLLWPGITNMKVTAPDGSLAGIISGIKALDRRRAWIITIGTAPAHQRQGLGAFMLHTMEQRLKRPRMRLTVRAGNYSAIRLYEQTGYAIIERKPRYYHNGEDGLVMEKAVARARG